MGKTCPRLRPGIAYTVIQRATVPGDFAHAVRRCEGRVGKRAATYALRSTPERARLPTLRRHVLFISKHCFHYRFARWLRSRKLASFAENLKNGCAIQPRRLLPADDGRNRLVSAHQAALAAAAGRRTRGDNF